MDPKNNFINGQPSIATNNDAERADDLSTTDEQLEVGHDKPVNDPALKGGEFENGQDDMEEKESYDAGMDEES